MRAVTLILAVSLLVPFAGVQAQGPPSLAPGTRIRVTAPGAGANKLVGTFVGARTDTLLVRTRPGWTPQSIPLASVTRLDMSRGRKSLAGAGAGIGGVIGAVSGAVVGAASCADAFLADPAQCALAGGLVVGAGGALLGAVVGALGKTDRWEEVPLDRLRVSFAPQRDGRFGLRLSVGF